MRVLFGALVALFITTACVATLRDPSLLIEASEEGLIPAGYYAGDDTVLIIQGAGVEGERFCLSDSELVVTGTLYATPLEDGAALVVVTDLVGLSDAFGAYHGGVPFVVEVEQDGLRVANVLGDIQEDELPAWMWSCGDETAEMLEDEGIFELCLAEGVTAKDLTDWFGNRSRDEGVLLERRDEPALCEGTPE